MALEEKRQIIDKIGITGRASTSQGTVSRPVRFRTAFDPEPVWRQGSGFINAADILRPGFFIWPTRFSLVLNAMGSDQSPPI